jgi:2-keto-4-pentenoate hydratase
MPSDTKLEAAASALREARAAVRPIARVSESFGIAGLDEAYAVASINTALRIQAGHRVLGRKVGLTSKAVQTQLGVDQPDFGVLFEGMEFLDGDELPMSALIQPKVEAELAFVVGRDLPKRRPSYSEFLASLAYVIPALEVVDSAIEAWRITLVDTVADNASCGLYVLGKQPFSLGLADLAEVPMQLSKNDNVESTGKGAACLGHPLKAAYWLACTMAERREVVSAGEVILSGALGPMVVLDAGDRVEAHFGPLGTVTCRASERSPA